MWLYNGSEFTQEQVDKYVGFVYCITNLTNGKRYIGKKSFYKTAYFQKNKKRKRKKVASDWLTYTGSNDTLNQDIFFGHTIRKEILYLCTAKGWMTYLETKEILVRDALLSENYYNFWVSCKIRRNHLK